MRRYELTNEEWERIESLLPPEKTGQKGRPRKSNRTMLNGMLWIARSGCQWRELPEHYGKWQGVYTRFRKWRNDGTLENVFRELSSDADMENLSIDSTSVKVHESANGGVKKGNPRR
jgi:Transposase and inactivated derivatives